MKVQSSKSGWDLCEYEGCLPVVLLFLSGVRMRLRAQCTGNSLVVQGAI